MNNHGYLGASPRQNNTGRVPLKLEEGAFRLPNLGRTVSHSMTPAVLKSGNNLPEEPYDDSKLRQQLAK
jgi:hypothetical protein